MNAPANQGVNMALAHGDVSTLPGVSRSTMNAVTPRRFRGRRARRAQVARAQSVKDTQPFA